jgi:hypothetical protein
MNLDMQRRDFISKRSFAIQIAHSGTNSFPSQRLGARSFSLITWKYNWNSKYCNNRSDQQLGHSNIRKDFLSNLIRIFLNTSWEFGWKAEVSDHSKLVSRFKNSMMSSLLVSNFQFTSNLGDGSWSLRRREFDCFGRICFLSVDELE